MKTVLGVYRNPNQHWVGDGFPVRSLFSYDNLGRELSPFLLLDYAGPHVFAPAKSPRGVGPHPHRGFETVTIVYDGEVAHHDSTGKGGIIGPGDVQWMTAGGGILHQEYHSPSFTKTGGPFRMVQLWVNLPAKDKKTPAGYQSILSTSIPVADLPNGGGKVRVIAGEFGQTRGPAKTFTPMNVWDMRLSPGSSVLLDLPDGHNSALVVLRGHVNIGGSQPADEAEMVLLSRDGSGVTVAADEDASVLVLSGAPIDEPIAGYGPFVMNSDAEIRRAIADFNSGRFGRMAGV